MSDISPQNNATDSHVDQQVPTGAASAHSRVPQLDGIRGLAILLVLTRHFTLGMKSVSTFDDWFESTAHIGWIGVDLFFVLSGFLITGILLDSVRKPRYFRNFFARRALRIFPLYYAVLAVIFFLLPLTAIAKWPEYRVLHDNQLWYWTYSSNFLSAIKGGAATPLMTSHFWSLAVEEQFYLLWPFCVFVSSRRVLLGVCVGCVIGSLVVRALLAVLAPESTASYVLLPARVDALAVGSALAIGFRSDQWIGLLSRSAKPVFATTGLILLITFFAQRGLEPKSSFMVVVGPTVVAFFFGALVAVTLVNRRGFLSAWFNSSFMGSFGRYSYALYIFHYPIVGIALLILGGSAALPVVGGLRTPAQLLFALTLTTVSFAAAWLSWHLFERHFLRLKDRFREAGDSRSASQLDAATRPVTTLSRVPAN